MSLARPERFPPQLEKLPLGDLLARLKNRLQRPPGWPRALAGLGGRRSGKPAACTDCLRGTTLYYGGVPLCDHHAKMRALEALTNDAKENSMNVTINGEEIEIPQEHSIGEHLDTIAKALVREGVAKDYSAGLDLARERHPDLAEVYDLGQIIEGPRNRYEPPEGADLLETLRVRYGKGGGDRSGIVSASTLFDLQNELFNVIKSEATRAGRSPLTDWEQLLKNDAELRRAVGLSRS